MNAPHPSAATATAAAATAKLPMPPGRRLHTTPRSACIARSSLYDLLGVSSSASTADVRNAYRRLAARYHPDVNSSFVAHEKFQALNLAAEVLTTPELRQQYDSRGTAALPGSRFGFLLDFLKQARAQGASAVLGEQGADLSTVLGVDFNEAVTGSAAAVTLDVLGPCTDCKGSGFDGTSLTVDCRVCKGSGEIMVRHWSPDGNSSSSSGGGSNGGSNGGSSNGGSNGGSSSMLTLLRSCPACRGSGKGDQQECKRCSGEGRVQVRRKVRFRVPGGVVDGQVLRVKGQGHNGKYGGAPGDLLVKLQVYDLADVRRHGDNLHSVLELTLYDALLGGSVPVRTVRGNRHIMVPSGVQHGQLLCIQGAGVARQGRSGVEYGHHYFEVAVRVPSAAVASEDELALLQRLAAALQQQPDRVHHGLRRPLRQQQQQSSSEVQQLSDDVQQSAASARQNQQQQQQQRQEQQQHEAAAAAGFGQHSSDPPQGAYG